MNNKSLPSLQSQRNYHSDVRAAKKEETRQHILDALVAKMLQGNFNLVSMEEIAAAAGIGVATLYRHFPNREALSDGLSNEFNRRVGGTTYPTTPDEIATYIQRDFAAFDKHPGLVQAFFLTEVGQNARSRGRSRRIHAIQASLSEVTGTLDESKRKQVTAVIAYLASLQSWMTMTTEFALSGAEVGQAVGWAIHILVNAVEQEVKDVKQ